MTTPIDNRTPNLNLPLPAQSNSLKDDVHRLEQALGTLDQEVANRVTLDTPQVVHNKILQDTEVAANPVTPMQVAPKQYTDSTAIAMAIALG